MVPEMSRATTPPLVVSAVTRPESPVTLTPPFTVVNLTSAPTGTRTEYLTWAPPMSNQPPPRGSLVAMLTLSF